jgi:hypothetical protein
MERIHESLTKRPRKLTIIYFHPTAHHVFMETGRFKVTQVLQCFIKDYETYIYHNI